MLQAVAAGHSNVTLSQAEVYTRAADNMRLADEYMHTIVPEQRMDEGVPLSETVESSGTFRVKKS